MVDISIVKTVTDYIPKVIVIMRTFIISILDWFKLDSATIFPLIALVVGLVLSYYLVKQWVTYSVFTKGKTLLFWILISLLIYISLVYIQ